MPLSKSVSRRQALSYLLGGGVALALAGGATSARARSLVKPWPSQRAVPALALPDLQGQPRQLAQWRGKVVVLNFWASWCEPCVAEMPSLLRLAEASAEHGVVVAAANYQESEGKVRSFLDTVLGEVPERLVVLLDRDGAAARAWTPRVFPSTVVIDRQGRGRWIVVGEMDWSGKEARALIDPLV
ncbi:MAG TPA: TlpA disulfide reductase family protein [Burkholderiaceae bacterium]|nr:TlpA disulfide reductase family protein [Burkholderiaceae bacterium]